ncbi:Co2+/Mg2+ efflux protein ApaG [Jiella endophytica]|uniref:Protein ApaG n=1 Tax=Jiella endophytica TaxID=2558362 RepID=A0A4Y8REP4_9HYPH|nr:Co2+/Mg2+ efflux protein ApaG [Jiella endophytica]TFF20775.1 Co2+/Mg2+ efflux protein ApaG [Jiella endophytica]TFF27076.1 Co2+/Mg2+ efflux protein ApaG [Jiella endophytica]
MYQATTRQIVVTVKPAYLEEQSDPPGGRWVWAYQVEIENAGDVAVQLQSRYWQITDAAGHVEEVRGPGVVGEQPVILPGDSFSYTSGCPLPTPSGIMRGSYHMRNDIGETFEVEIPAFSLDLPGDHRTLN